MKVLVELENGKTVEFRNIRGIDANDTGLLMITNRYLSNADRARLEQELTASIGRRCIILPPFITNVLGVTSGSEQCH